MTDDDLTAGWRTMNPTHNQRLAIQTRLTTELEAHDTPLVLEWLRLVKIAPFRTLGLAGVSTVAIAAPVLFLVAGLA